MIRFSAGTLSGREEQVPPRGVFGDEEIEMNPFVLLLLTMFFGIFHLLGGGAIGQGVHALRRGSDQWRFLFLWGALMGGVPLIFDWFFLISQDYMPYGLVGPAVFVISAFVSAYLDLDIDGGAVISAALGSSAFLIGLFSIPLMLDRSQASNPGMEDYLFGGCFVLLFVVIGGSFAWNGFSAILRGISLDQAYVEREEKLERPRDRKEE